MPYCGSRVVLIKYPCVAIELPVRDRYVNQENHNSHYYPYTARLAAHTNPLHPPMCMVQINTDNEAVATTLPGYIVCSCLVGRGFKRKLRNCGMHIFDIFGVTFSEN